MEPKTSIGVWIRVSTEDQAKGESPEHHEKRARMYAEAKGWDVAEVWHMGEGGNSEPRFCICRRKSLKQQPC